MPTHVFFKDEDELDGEPIGPCTITQGEDTRRPFLPRCRCEEPAGHPDEVCSTCEGRVPQRWVSLAEAEDIAREHGVTLERT